MFDNYKIIKMESLVNYRKIILPSQFFGYNSYNDNRFFTKCKDVSINKIFLLDLSKDIFWNLSDKISTLMKVNGIQSINVNAKDFCNSLIWEIEKSNFVKEKYDKTIQNNIEFSTTEYDRFNKIDCNFDSSIMNSHFVDESWLDEPVVYGSICTKCSYDNPWTPHDPVYVCYKCKIGY